MATTTTLALSDITDACIKLSKYTGREQTGADGSSLFEQILIQDRDSDLIGQYAVEAAVELNKWLLPFCSLDVGDENLSWVWDDTYEQPASFPHIVKQYIVNWCMGMWMRDKVAERAEYFKAEAERLGASLPPKIFRAKPN